MTAGTIAPTSAGTGHANFGRLLTSEWTKLRTVRSTTWSLIVLVTLMLGLTVLLNWATNNQWKNADTGTRAEVLADPTSQFLGGSLFFAQLAICVLGVLVTAGEYSTGMIRSTLLASPHRLRMLAAKSVIFTFVVLVVGEAVAFPCFFIGREFLKTKVTVGLSDPGVLRAVVGEGLYLALLGLFSLAIGSIIRHTAGAITGTIAFVLVISQTLQLIPGTVGRHLYSYSPNVAGMSIITSKPRGNALLTGWEGLGVFGLWTAALLALAGWLLVRRDA